MTHNFFHQNWTIRSILFLNMLSGTMFCKTSFKYHLSFSPPLDPNIFKTIEWIKKIAWVHIPWKIMFILKTNHIIIILKIESWDQFCFLIYCQKLCSVKYHIFSLKYHRLIFIFKPWLFDCLQFVYIFANFGPKYFQNDRMNLKIKSWIWTEIMCSIRVP